MKKLILALGLTALTFSPALAQDADFAATDANGDGMVTMEEAAAAGYDWSQEDFNAADTDGSGALSQEEFDAATAG
ncbi:calmodulin [Zhengella mangrovi]|uniref:Calmodulin n=1 Tax=Zhengella mangrovi TaxID=1982044 RepID=A0A2G1QHA2_9HYPH|nr:calmodulin [Zhengella mangrovi]PHP64849.1 calmodulin [Zhengella mangrovi]